MAKGGRQTILCFLLCTVVDIERDDVLAAQACVSQHGPHALQDCQAYGGVSGIKGGAGAQEGVHMTRRHGNGEGRMEKEQGP